MPAGVDSLLVYLLVLNAALAALVVVVMIRLRTLARRVAMIAGDPQLLDRVGAAERHLEGAARRIEQLGGQLEGISVQTSRCLQRVGLVRYDAFQDLGGHLSFSVALLDSRRDGVVVSVLNDRAGAHAYAKPIVGGRSTFTLSEEEQRAITQS